MTLKALIVDDMATYRSIITRSMAQIEGVEVVGKASNGKKALDFLANHDVDLITLDVEMPIMDGLATLKALRERRCKADVIMLSGLSDQAAQLTIECLELGAIDFVLKPQTASFIENQNQLVESLKTIIATISKKTPSPQRRQRSRPGPPRPREGTPSRPRRALAAPASLRPKILLIGVSTGGPKALSVVFDQLEGPLPFPIMIVQHMPAKFTRSLAESLDRKSEVKVVEANDGDVLEGNTAYIAPGGHHMVLLKDSDFGLVAGLSSEPPVNSCRPSADVLFESAAPIFDPGEVAVLVMTGMGRDGAAGAGALRKSGAFIASQSAETCTIYGMPKAVEDLGLQHEVLDLDEIAPFIQRIAKSSPSLLLKSGARA